MALKVESAQQPKQVLKMEVAVLKKLQGEEMERMQIYFVYLQFDLNIVVMLLLLKLLASFRDCSMHLPKLIFTLICQLTSSFWSMFIYMLIHYHSKVWGQ